jgi:hypothetical protein
MLFISPTSSMYGSATLRLFCTEPVNFAGSAVKASLDEYQGGRGSMRANGCDTPEAADTERAHGCTVSSLSH